jgi:hypothetical protein
MTKRLRVGVDIDGVLYDFARSLHQFVCPDAPFQEPLRWEFYLDWGMTEAEFKAAFHAGVDAGVIFTYGAPFPRVCDGFRLIKAAGHTIHMVTDRSQGTGGASEAATRSWLDRYDLPFDSLTFAADKTVVRLDVMVDDKPENYEALTAAGVDTFLLTRRWNQHVRGAQRVLDFYHFAELICS